MAALELHINISPGVTGEVPELGETIVGDYAEDEDESNGEEGEG
jgi:hypothetical protein